MSANEMSDGRVHSVLSAESSVLARLARHARLWRRFVAMALVREAEYRASFLVSVLEGIAQLGLAVLTLVLLYGYTDGIGGWSADEAFMLVGVYRVADGLLALQVAPNMLRVSGYIQRGEMDFILLRPVSSRFLVSLRWLQPPEAVNVLIGLGLVYVAGERAGVDWRLAGVLSACALGACGLMIAYCLWFGSVTLAFWLVSVGPIGDLFYAVWETARYPVTFFRGLVRATLTFLLPVAFATTFPTQALLGEADARLLAVGALLAAAALLGTQLFWRVAVRRYSSASS